MRQVLWVQGCVDQGLMARAPPREALIWVGCCGCRCACKHRGAGVLGAGERGVAGAGRPLMEEHSLDSGATGSHLRHRPSPLQASRRAAGCSTSPGSRVDR